MQMLRIRARASLAGVSQPGSQMGDNGTAEHPKGLGSCAVVTKHGEQRSFYALCLTLVLCVLTS